jgi:hypothetical protein
LISLSLVAILSFSVVSVAAASVSYVTTVTHSAYITGTTTGQFKQSALQRSSGIHVTSLYLYPSESRIATTITGDKWTAMAQEGGIVKGTSYGFGFDVFTLPSNKKICGQWVNFYLDDKPAPGKWNTNPNPECWVSAQLLLSADETAQLSLGMHTLKVDYLGDNTYAPSHWEGTFNVKATVSG